VEACRLKIKPQRVCIPVVADFSDLYHSDGEQDPDPHESERSVQDRIKVKGRIRIQIKVKRWTRIRIKGKIQEPSRFYWYRGVTVLLPGWFIWK
jgi:hypothetical protein